MKIIQTDMMKLAEAVQSGIQEISLQQARDMRLVGPVMHGAPSPDVAAKIRQEGFRFEEADARSGGTSHGYDGKQAYHNNIPAPVHHLGYGAYFTFNKTQGMQYAYGNSKSLLKDMYLQVPRMTTINFGAPNTMMKWWIANGYDPELAKRDRVAATKQMTAKLASQYDAVYFKGKGLRTLLDGDQICVYQPKGKVFIVNPKLAQPGDIGSTVRRKEDGMKGKLINKRPILPEHKQFCPPEATHRYEVKWQKGGTDMNVYDHTVDHL